MTLFAVPDGVTVTNYVVLKFQLIVHKPLGGGPLSDGDFLGVVHGRGGHVDRRSHDRHSVLVLRQRRCLS